jgi:flagella basal body P-ring formation protein FlgA
MQKLKIKNTLMRIITRHLTSIRPRFFSIAYLIIFIGLHINTYANNIELAIKFLKSQTFIAKDADITIHPVVGQYNFESCKDINFSVKPNNHKSTSLRLLANCNTPDHWTIFLNATIKQKQHYFITRRPLKRGEIITTQDLQSSYDSKASTVSNVATKLEELNNLAAAHDIKIGTILRQNDLIEPILVTRYEQVKIINNSNGFSVTTFGKSLNSATKGRSVRVQLPNKQVITGKAVAAGTIEIAN